MIVFQSVNALRRLYPSVEEVDLFPAAMAEAAAPGALLGPTFVCLVGDQFSRLRRGDRFYYEESGQPSTFSPGTHPKIFLIVWSSIQAPQTSARTA